MCVCVVAFLQPKGKTLKEAVLARLAATILGSRGFLHLWCLNWCVQRGNQNLEVP